jgi:hypothetical protein
VFVSRCCSTYPTNDKCTIVKPQLPLVLANKKPGDQKGCSNGDERPGDDGHERTMALFRVTDPRCVGSHRGGGGSRKAQWNAANAPWCYIKIQQSLMAVRCRRGTRIKFISNDVWIRIQTVAGIHPFLNWWVPAQVAKNRGLVHKLNRHSSSEV